jgi:hypothetical protein
MFMFLLDQKCVGSVACDSLVDLEDEKWYNLLRQINFGVGSGGFYKNDFLGVAISKEIGNSLWVIFIPNGFFA